MNSTTPLTALLHRSLEHYYISRRPPSAYRPTTTSSRCAAPPTRRSTLRKAWHHLHHWRHPHHCPQEASRSTIWNEIHILRPANHFPFIILANVAWRGGMGMGIFTPSSLRRRHRSGVIVSHLPIRVSVCLLHWRKKHWVKSWGVSSENASATSASPSSSSATYCTQ